jgi:hypothetical protein
VIARATELWSGPDSTQALAWTMIEGNDHNDVDGVNERARPGRA